MPAARSVKKPTTVKALVKRVEALEADAEDTTRFKLSALKKLRLHDSTILELKQEGAEEREANAAERAENARRHEETQKRLDGIENEAKESNKNQRLMIDLTQQLLAIERQNRGLDTPVLPARPSDDTLITNPPPVSTGTIHGS